jgi:hypothetical protein
MSGGACYQRKELCQEWRREIEQENEVVGYEGLGGKRMEKRGRMSRI